MRGKMPSHYKRVNTIESNIEHLELEKHETKICCKCGKEIDFEHRTLDLFSKKEKYYCDECLKKKNDETVESVDNAGCDAYDYGEKEQSSEG